MPGETGGRVMETGQRIGDERILLRGAEDLRTVSAQSAAWSQTGPQGVADGLADTLFRILPLSLVYVRVLALAGREIHEAARPQTDFGRAQWTADFHEAVKPDRACGGSAEPLTIADPCGTGTVRLATVPLGCDGESGYLAAGSQQPEFPGPMDRLLLEAAANQAAVVLQYKQSEQALRESEKRLSYALDATTEGVWDWNIKTGVVLFSRRWIDSLEYSPDEVPAHVSFWERIVHPEDLPRVREGLRAHLEGRVPVYSCENRLRKKSGAYRWNLDRGKVVEWDADGQPLRMVGTDTDISERKVAEEALRENEERLRLATQTGKVGIWDWDIVTNRVSWTDSLYAIHGLSRESFNGRVEGFTSFVHPEDRDLVSRAIEASLHRGAPYELEFRAVKPDGQVTWLFTNAIVLRSGDRPVRMVGATVDITERKQAEELVRYSEERFRSLVDQAPFSIQVFSPDGRTIRVNRAWEELWGVRREQIEGYNVLEDRQLEAKGVLPYVRQGFAGQATRIPAIQYDPNETIPDITEDEDPRRWLSAIIYPIRASDGNVREVVLIHEDITARHRAEEELRSVLRQKEETLALLDTLQQNAPIGFAFVDRQFRYVRINEALAAIDGNTPEYHLGRTVEETVPELWPKLEPLYRRVLESGQPVINQEVTGETPAEPGRPGHWLVNYYPVHVQGEVVGIGLLVSDITERMAAEVSVRESEAKFRQLAENFHDVIWLGLPREHRVLYVSPVYEEIWGRSREELYADFMQWIEAIHVEDRERVGSAFFNRVLEGGYDEEYRIVRPDGTVRWIRDRGFPIREPSGEVRRVVGAAEDITERKQTEQRLEAVLASISDHLVTYDRGWRYTFLTDKAAEVLGKRKEELLGRCIWDVFPEAVGNQYYREVHAAFAEQKIIRSEHYYAAFEKWYENHIYPSVDGVTVFSADVTWRKALEQEVQRRVQELALADRRKDEFLAMLAHELRNPLAPIRTGLDLLALKAGRSETIRLMQEQVDHLVRLVDDLLDVSRIVRGKVELRREAVELATVVNRAVETVRPLVEERRHQITVELPADPVVLHADPVRLAQVLTNLLNNSAKYTDSGGRIVVAAELNSDGVLVRVQDDGVGIEPDLLPHVFDLFTQSERSIDRSQGGLGLGLTLVKSLVEMHDGTVSARSEGHGRGSEFLVRLPIARVEASRSHGLDSRQTVCAGRRILVVDDNVGAANMLRLLLSHCTTSEVVIAHDGLAALEAAAQYQPEIILLDIGLPRMDGYEVARRLRSDPTFERTLLVAVTGYGQEGDIERSKQAGFDEHLVKPPPMESILRLLIHPKLSNR